MREDLMSADDQQSMPAGAYWGFPLSQETYNQSRTLIRKVREGDFSDEARLNRQVADAVLRLVDDGLYTYYYRPLELTPLHPALKKTADASIQAVRKALQSVARRVFKSRSSYELALLADYLEPMLKDAGDSDTPYLVFELSEGLYQKSIALIEAVRNDDDTSAYLDDIAEALCELVEASVDHYYQRPSMLLEMGGTTRKAADMGIGTAEKGIRALIKRVVRELPYRDMVHLSYYVESLIHDAERGGQH